MKQPIFALWACVLGAVVAFAAPAKSAEIPDEILTAMRAADVVILGEAHDNPGHHKRQEAAVAALQPKAVVWEMLTGLTAQRVDTALVRQPEELATLLQWAESGWPDFNMYYPIFAAAPTARVYGGNVPREAARSALKAGSAVAFGADAARYGLSVPLQVQERQEREAAQMADHCDALPRDMIAGMVDIQRLRDATLARAAIDAVDETGGPVAVITGNGHARRDWGIPVYLQRVRPDLTVFVLGQSEAGWIDGEFDAVLDSPAVPRDDPCAAFSGSG